MKTEAQIHADAPPSTRLYVCVGERGDLRKESGGLLEASSMAQRIPGGYHGLAGIITPFFFVLSCAIS